MGVAFQVRRKIGRGSLPDLVEPYLYVYNVAFVCFFAFTMVFGGGVLLIVAFFDFMGVVGSYVLTYILCGMAGYPVWWLVFLVLRQFGLPDRLIGVLAAVPALWTSLAMLPYGVGWAFGATMSNFDPLSVYTDIPAGFIVAIALIGPATALLVCGDE